MSGISKRFPGVVALDAVDFHVAAGEVVGLVGENGAGKSTLMKILAGVHRPDAGEMRIDGVAVRLRNPADASQHGIGIIHQELEIVDTLDAPGNVFLGHEPRRGRFLPLIDRRAMEERTRGYLARLGADIPLRAPLSQLSTAQQQLVAIARAFSRRARVLVFDEPTASLTARETDRLLALLRDLRRDGLAVVYISHRLAEVAALADRVVVLRDGRMAGSLDREAIDRDAMVRLMVGRDVIWVPAASTRPPGAACLQIERLRTGRYPAAEVSLTVHAGEILGLAGLIGSGRSELATAVCGLDAPAGGRVVLLGEPVPPSSPRAAIARGLYLVPEDRRRCGLITTACVRENLSLPSLRACSRRGLVDAARERDETRRMAEALQVRAASLETLAGTLSGGNQQKVVVAKWLALQPRVIVFDEPTRGIDVGARAEIYRLMRGLADGGAGVLMISSDMEEILTNSDRVAVMHEGRVTGVLDRAACTPESIMQLAVA